MPGATVRTGIPLVDAGMRQLAEEGCMHNRARLVTASFLVQDLGVDWRRARAHFLDLLVDGDVANNSGNWQWVAGPATNTRPNRVFNPLRQAERFDPWRIRPPLRAGTGRPRPRLDPDAVAAAPAQRVRLGYPGPLVEPS